ncbi:MAG: helix-turn-helix transcriptional regulator [Thiobacillus sp.]|nr:helix-turn-helix transcriptional regulator [Thiobacillus sp.]
MGKTEPRMQALIDRVYDAAIDDSAWCGLGDQIARTFGSTSAVLKVQDSKERVHLVDMTPNLMIDPKHQDWAEHWHRNDLWVEKSVAFGMSKIVTNRDLVPDVDFERTDFYGDWVRHLDIYHMIGAVFPVAGDTIGILGIHRPDRAGSYENADRHRLAGFLPHLLRAFQLRQKLAKAQLGAAAAFDALERSGSAILVVNGDRSVLFANRIAEQMLRQNQAFCLTQGKLDVRQPDLSSRLAGLVQRCVQTASGAMGSPGGTLAIRREGRLPLTLTVAPLRPMAAGCGVSQPAALIFIRDPEVLAASAQMSRELFGLTRTEAAVAQALAEGRALNEIAEALGIGMGTVRSHLKQIFAKTGTKKQAQLVALLLRCIPNP